MLQDPLLPVPGLLFLNLPWRAEKASVRVGQTSLFFYFHSLVYWSTLVQALIFEVLVLANSLPSEKESFVPTCYFLSSKLLLIPERSSPLYCATLIYLCNCCGRTSFKACVWVFFYFECTLHYTYWNTVFSLCPLNLFLLNYINDVDSAPACCSYSYAHLF